jgi:hypothetical protein
MPGLLVLPTVLVAVESVHPGWMIVFKVLTLIAFSLIGNVPILKVQGGVADSCQSFSCTRTRYRAYVNA